MIYYAIRHKPSKTLLHKEREGRTKIKLDGSKPPRLHVKKSDANRVLRRLAKQHYQYKLALDKDQKPETHNPILSFDNLEIVEIELRVLEHDKQK